LFSWKLYFNWEYRVPGGVRAICFNPCFPGSSTSTKSQGVGFCLGIGFQSLFSWKLYFNFIFPITRWKTKTVSILVFLEALLQLGIGSFVARTSWSFNPCFPGSSTSTLEHCCLSSLFFCFNPCFPGSSTSTFWYPFRYWGLYCVSILVFLEALLQRKSHPSSPMPGLCFNPCFPGSSTSTW